MVAVLAVVAGSLAFVTTTAVATPDVSVTICHATSSRSNPYVQITVNGSSINEVANDLANGHGDHTGPVFSESLPKHTDWGDIIPAFGSFPGINADSTSWIENGCQAPSPTVFTGEASVSGSLAICTADSVDVTVEYASGVVTRTSTDSQVAADAAAQAAAEAAALADRDGQLAGYPGYTEGVCPAGPTVFTGEASVSGSLAICTADSVDVTVEYASGVVTRTSTDSQVAADAAAQAAAEAAAQADLTTQLAAYPGAEEGTCPVTPPVTPPTPPPASPPTSPETVAPVLPATVDEPVAPTEPETVAPVLPATVEEPPMEPETVWIPQPATVTLPATIPAGDGSSGTRIPTVAVALLAVGLLGAAASSVTLLARRRTSG